MHRKDCKNQISGTSETEENCRDALSGPGVTLIHLYSDTRPHPSPCGLTSPPSSHYQDPSARTWVPANVTLPLIPSPYLLPQWPSKIKTDHSADFPKFIQRLASLQASERHSNGSILISKSLFHYNLGSQFLQLVLYFSQNSAFPKYIVSDPTIYTDGNKEAHQVITLTTNPPPTPSASLDSVDSEGATQPEHRV